MAGDAIGLGRYCRWDSNDVGPRLDFRGDEGVMLVGVNGSGKDTRIFAPLLLQNHGTTIVVVDLKGEQAAITAPYRRLLGPVYIINPYRLHCDVPGYEDLKSCRYNPLLAIDKLPSDQVPMQTGVIADTIIELANGDGKHFDESARGLAQAAIFIERIDAQEERRPPSMRRVRRLISLPSGFDAEIKSFYGWPAFARLHVNRPSYNYRELKNLLAQFADWTKEKSSIASTAQRQTKSFDDVEIARDMEGVTFDFSVLRRQPCTVYIIVPPLLIERQSRWLRMIVDAALRAVMRPRAPGQPKTILLLNEIYAYGDQLESLRTVWSLVRGYGVQVLAGLQNLNQLTIGWGKDEASNMLAAAGVIASFRTNDQETADWLSRRAGDTTRIMASYNQGEQQGRGQGSSSGLSWGPHKVPAVPPSALFGLGPGRMIQFVTGVADHVPAYAPPYWRIEECAARARANPFHLKSGTI